MGYTTTLLCTKVNRPPLSWSPPIPIDIESSLGTVVNAQPFAQASSYGLPADSLLKVLRRNYEPQTWRITGSITAHYRYVGWMNTPLAEPTMGDPANYDEVLKTEVFNFDSGADPEPPKVMPDFSVDGGRVIAEYNFEVEHVASGPYPLAIFPDGSIKSAYLVETYNISLNLLPYTWEYQGGFYLEQEVIIEPTERSLRTGPGQSFEPATLDEGSAADGSGGVQSVLSDISGFEIKGQCTARDPLMTAFPNWGEIDLWGRTPEMTISASMEARCTRHYLVRPWNP